MHLVDFHSHILPRADHGSSSLEESLEQISLMRENGIDEVVATPHFYAHVESLSVFRERIDSAYNTLVNAMQEKGWDVPCVHLGAEVLLFAGLDNLDGLDTLTIKGTNTLLLELPYTEVGTDIFNTVHRIIKKGYVVVLAHADRYKRDDIDQLIGMGAMIQLNADALDALFVKPIYKRWLNDGVVVALGSDIHGVNPKAYKSFLNAEKKIKKYWDNIQFASKKLLKQ